MVSYSPDLRYYSHETDLFSIDQPPRLGSLAPGVHSGSLFTSYEQAGRDVSRNCHTCDYGAVKYNPAKCFRLTRHLVSVTRLAHFGLRNRIPLPRYSWALTLVVSSAIVFVILGFSLTLPFLVKAQQSVDKADEKHAALAAEVFGSIRTVFALGAEQPLFKK